MERNRENRRGSSHVGGNFSSSFRRSRASFKEPSGVSEVDDGTNEIHDSSVRLRDRSSNGGRMDRSSRRRLNSSDIYHIDRDEIAEGTTDESMDEDREEEDEPIRAGNLRRTTTTATTTNRIKPTWKASDEMIGVSVPRKTRSACAKRTHEPSPPVFVMGGGSSMLSDGLIRGQSSSSPVRTAVASVSPPPSNASMRTGKRMKPTTMKTKPAKTTATEVSISESEVEVAQFLYGLTRLQDHPSATKTESFRSCSPKHDLKHHQSLNEGPVSVVSKASSPISTTPFSQPSSSPSLLHHSSSSPATVMAPKRKKPRPVKLEDSGSTTMLACSSIPAPLGSNNVSNFTSPNGAPAPKIEVDKDSEATKMEVLSPKSEKIAGTGDGASKVEPSLQISSPLQTASQRDIQPEEKMSYTSPTESKPLPSLERKKNPTTVPTRAENPVSAANCQSSIDQITPNESSPGRELAVPLVQEGKSNEPNIISSTSTAVEGLHADKFKIDLMALPTNSSLDSDGIIETAEKNVSETTDPKPIPVIEETACYDKETANQAVKMETEEAKVRPDSSVPDADKKIQTKEATGEVDLEKQSVNDGSSQPHPDDNKLDEGGNRQQTQKPKSTARQAERIVPPAGVAASTSSPVPVALPGWPGGLPPFGYLGSNPANLSGVPSLQGAIPLEGNAAIPNAPFLMLPPVRSNRCAIHCYIARLVHYQQQLARFNPFWAAASTATFYGAKPPYNLSILPNSDALMLDGSLIRNSTSLPHSRLVSGSIVTPNGHNDKVPSSFDAQRKQSQIPPSAQQGAAFIFPVTQSKTGGTKSGNVTDSAGLLSASAAAVAATGSGGVATVNSNFSSLAAATSDPQYLAMLHGSYPFPIPPAYRVHIGQQQQQQSQPAMAHGIEFVRPFFPAQLLQLQPQSLPQTQNPTTSTGSSSSQKRLQTQHCFPAAKPPLDSRESTGNGEDGADSRTTMAQKKLPNQNLSSNTGLKQRFPQNFAIMAAAMGGKQQPQQHNDPNVHMSLKGKETAAPAPPGHSVLQRLPELGRHQYQIPVQPLQLADQLQISAANQAKTAGRVPSRINDKPPESGRPQGSTVGSAQQLQKQALVRTRPASANASSTPTSGMAYADRAPVVYSNAGAKLPTGSSPLPNMQSPQWKMPQRMSPSGSPGSASVSASPPLKGALPGQSGSASFQQTGQTTVGSPAGKGAKQMSPPVSSSRKPTTLGPAILAQSLQIQGPAKTQLRQQHHIQTQQLFFPSSEPTPQHSGGPAGLYQKPQAMSQNSSAQALFSAGMSQRRSDQQAQSAPMLTLASSGAFIGGGNKGSVSYNSLGSNSVAVMAASYAQSPSNLPVKSTEQKPAAGRLSSSYFDLSS